MLSPAGDLQLSYVRFFFFSRSKEHHIAYIEPPGQVAY